MKHILLLIAIMLIGLFIESRLNKSSDQQVVQATVVSVKKIKNKRKGSRPFVYQVRVKYNSSFGRSHDSSFITQSRPYFQKGEKINIVYSISKPSKVNPRRKMQESVL